MPVRVNGIDVIDNTRNIVNIDSYSGNGVATKDEAVAGTNNDQLMTPLRVKQAIDEAMAGLSYPDISTDGWPGTDKGHAGFGAFMTATGGVPYSSDSGSGAQKVNQNQPRFDTSIMPFGETYDPLRLQDLVTRNCPSWEFNRTANKSTTELKPVTGSIGFRSTANPNPNLGSIPRNEINIRFPNPLGSKTLDIYIQGRFASAFNDQASQDLLFRWTLGISNSTNIITATTAYERVFDGGSQRQGATYRYRVTDAPESTVLNIAASGIDPDFANVNLCLCYYEVY